MSEPVEECLYRFKGDDLEKIIAKDEHDRRDPDCAFAGCAVGVKYKYCDRF